MIACKRTVKYFFLNSLLRLPFFLEISSSTVNDPLRKLHYGNIYFGNL